MKMCGIIFSEMYSDELNAFTHDRNMAAIPYGGRYRLVDFALSNMVNSGITSVGVLAKQHYHSLMTHLGNTQEWDLNRKNGGLQILPPYASESLNQANRGKLDELRNALDFLREDPSPYVVMADAHVICNMDFRPVLESHIKSGCDITVVGTQSNLNDNTISKSVIHADENMRVTSYALDHVPQAGDYCGMSIMVPGTCPSTSIPSPIPSCGLTTLRAISAAIWLCWTRASATPCSVRTVPSTPASTTRFPLITAWTAIYPTVSLQTAASWRAMQRLL